MHTAYVLMGYPGSGKSHLCKSLHSSINTRYLSSDELREELYGFRDQTHNKEVFEELYRRAINYRHLGDVIIDSTSLTRKDRARVINALGKHFKMNLICVLRPITEVVTENKNREINSPLEYIPEEIFKTILGRFQIPTKDEGWDDISFYMNTTDIHKTLIDYNQLEDIPHDNPHHPETIKEHINYVVNRCCSLENLNTNFGRLVSDIAYWHDTGKFFVIQYNEDKGYSQCIGHAAVSAYIYLCNLAFSRYKFVGELVSFRDVIHYKNDLFVLLGVYYHDYPFTLSEKSDLINSLSKPSKPVLALFKEYSDNPEHELDNFVDILLRFNFYDRLRENKDE